MQAADTAPRSEAIYVVAGGWHTELALPAPPIGGKLATLTRSSPGTRYVVFGWGARAYYMERDPSLGDLLRATVPGPAVVLVIPLQVAPAVFAGAANAYRVAVLPPGIGRLERFLWDGLAKGPDGMPRRIGPGPYPDSAFYASTGTFDLGHTCNTWTAEALRVADLPINPAGVVYPAQLLDQLPPPGRAATEDRQR